MAGFISFEKCTPKPPMKLTIDLETDLDPKTIFNGIFLLLQDGLRKFTLEMPELGLKESHSWEEESVEELKEIKEKQNSLE